MLDNLLEFLKDKRIMILGYGREGKSTHKFLREHFPEMLITIVDSDMNLLEKNPELFEDIYVEVSLGTDYFAAIDEFDLVIKTPGITLKDYDISRFRDKIYSQLQLFLEFVPVYTVGITGTKGKSTTSSIIYKIIKDQNTNVKFMGNIGIPYFDEIEDINENTICVLELSSHALEFIHNSPNIAILLNVYEEHLDHHNCFEEYVAAKFNIAKFQTEKDYFLYNSQNANMRRFVEEEHFNCKSNKIKIISGLEGVAQGFYSISQKSEDEDVIKIESDTIKYNNTELTNVDFKRNILGDHNLHDLLFVFGVIKVLNLDFEKALDSIAEFKPLEHRMEFVKNVNGVDYYNDSISTIPMATINAVNALEKIKHINTLIVGGKDRGVNLEDLYKFLAHCKVENIICMPKTGEFIYNYLKANLAGAKEILEDKELEIVDKSDSLNDNGKVERVIRVDTIGEAVSKAKELTASGCICLLSPAASSYGYFKNFEDRGRQFKEAVISDN